MSAAVSPPGPAPDLAPGTVDDPSQLRAAHTPNFPEVFRQLGALLPRPFPDLINDDETLVESSFVIPTEHLGEVAATV
jgi:hypothetical protein